MKARNQRVCHCTECGINFLTWKQTAYCSSRCRHTHTDKLKGVTKDGIRNTGN